MSVVYGIYTPLTIYRTCECHDFSSASEGVSINVPGSKPGTTPTNTQSSATVSNNRHKAGEQAASWNPRDQYPRLQSAVVVVESPTVSFGVCRNGSCCFRISIERLWMREEISPTVNRLSNNEWISETYDTIPLYCRIILSS
jgi:hypothetical protein